MNSIIAGSTKAKASQSKYCCNLGIDFFTGTAAEGVDAMPECELLVLRAAPVLKYPLSNAGYSVSKLNTSLPRYRVARKLAALMFRYRGRSPITDQPTARPLLT